MDTTKEQVTLMVETALQAAFDTLSKVLPPNIPWSDWEGRGEEFYGLTTGILNTTGHNLSLIYNHFSSDETELSPKEAIELIGLEFLLDFFIRNRKSYDGYEISEIPEIVDCVELADIFVAKAFQDTIL